MRVKVKCGKCDKVNEVDIELNESKWIQCSECGIDIEVGLKLEVKTSIGITVGQTLTAIKKQYMEVKLEDNEYIDKVRLGDMYDDYKKDKLNEIDQLEDEGIKYVELPKSITLDDHLSTEMIYKGSIEERNEKGARVELYVCTFRVRGKRYSYFPELDKVVMINDMGRVQIEYRGCKFDSMIYNRDKCKVCEIV